MEKIRICNENIRYPVFLSLMAVFILLCAFFHASESHAFGGCEENCQKCHNLSHEEITLVLKKIKVPDAKVLKVQMSPVKGLWEVAIEDKGQRGLLYIDFSKKYIVSGSIIEVNASINKTRERVEELNKDKKINPSGISLKDALVLGSKTARKKVIVFTDPD